MNGKMCPIISIGMLEPQLCRGGECALWVQESVGSGVCSLKLIAQAQKLALEEQIKAHAPKPPRLRKP